MVLNPVISKLTGKLVVLASASPRRREILTNVGLKFEVVPSWFKETLDKALFKHPHEYAVETARQKALEVAKRMPCKHLKTPDIVIGADTVVTVDGLILEKPVDKQDAYNMLSRLSGKEHSVFTGVAIALCQEPEGREVEYRVYDFYEETKVKFADLSEEMLWEYIHSGEPMDKAGGYGIQALGGMLVEYVQGDFLNVVGFPLNHFCKRLGQIYDRPSEPLGRSKLTECAENRKTVGDPSERCEGAVPGSASGGAAHKPNFAGPHGGDDRNPNFPHKIVELMDGFKASKCLFVASKLKVFDLLTSAEGVSAAEVAGKIQAPEEAAERLLDALVSLDLLTKMKRGETTGETAAYRNADAVSRYLVSTGERSLHGYILYCNEDLWPLCTQLELAVLEGGRQFGKRPKVAFQDDHYSDKDRRLRFMKGMHSIAMVTGGDVATAFDLSGFKTACDLGGCTGAMAYEFTRAHPGLSVTVFDLPAVVEMSGEFCPEHQDTSRVTFVAGDFITDDLPRADLYILARILHDLSDENVDLLLSKLSTICSPGCGLLVSEIFLDDQRSGPSRALLQALSMTAGRQRSAAEYLLQMNKHGFSQARVRHTHNFLDALLCIRE
ncbi:probable bifunctional dTTP/UTP pyrophosphatase/methyltransferase protein isoform X1 [Anguilla anguilla]|uniref:probable bifunctional dTTP/UTP pyrophosphatase/methyltransferase protein isoform X1 n=1 Tax=Anguilla anguilla TaxID=7936 RepID=UPI0015AF3BDB|nr:probable bifunctional dTTP/UTP pyrophosphatase/methyltransferase protein isoform X1 [Anguilla anguilla]XP_035249119.1 probable bifunctional dTTP/UTP pyrophosphatase/methyltransferase protein isoform X1 [Anguilla anguilla]